MTNLFDDDAGQTVLHSLYRQFRKSSPFMLVGENATQALNAARVIKRWQELEASGDVAISKQFDHDSDASFYDYWEHLSERTREQLKADYSADCWVVQTVVIDEFGTETVVDSIGGCSGYDDPCSPFENCYVVGMMETAIKHIDATNYQI